MRMLGQTLNDALTAPSKSPALATARALDWPAFAAHVKRIVGVDAVRGDEYAEAMYGWYCLGAQVAIESMAVAYADCPDCHGKGKVEKTNGWMLFDGWCPRCFPDWKNNPPNNNPSLVSETPNETAQTKEL